MGNNQIVSYDYNDYNGKITAIHYENGDSLKYVYDDLENVVEVWYADDTPVTDDIQMYAYSYNAYGQLYRFDNLVSKESIIYEYDANKRLVGFVEFDTDEMSSALSAAIEYNDKSQISGLEYSFDYTYLLQRTSGAGWTYAYDYNNDGSVKSTIFNVITYSDTTSDDVTTDGTIDYTYDRFNRLVQKIYTLESNYETGIVTRTGNFTNTVNYTYVVDSGNNTSLFVKSYQSQVNANTATTYTYDYDKNGNITKIVLSSGEEFRYQYDDMGQLLREDNTALDRTYVYEYDNAGNITKKYTYALTAEHVTPTNLISTYVYGYDDANWGDKLTSYRGQSLTYDGIGNPLTYFNGNSYTFTWGNGRRLGTAAVGGNALSFTYNDEGIRTSKTANGVKHTYVLNGSQIITEEWSDKLIIFLYDAEGSPIGMQYRAGNMEVGVFEEYWFEKNLQGDIVAVYNAEGTKLISYTYDAWGNFTTTYHNGCTTSSTAAKNPFRYRGYYYDSELGMYYLQSRYYDPVVGRFINADAFVSTGQGILGNNMYAYCHNNPVKYVDLTGEFVISSILLVSIAGGALAGAIVSTISYMKTSERNGEAINGKNLADAMLLGIVTGGLGGAAGAIGGVPAAGLSVLAGAFSVGYTVKHTQGPTEQKKYAGIYAFATTATAAYLGAKIPCSAQ